MSLDLHFKPNTPQSQVRVRIENGNDRVKVCSKSGCYLILLLQEPPTIEISFPRSCLCRDLDVLRLEHQMLYCSSLISDLKLHFSRIVWWFPLDPFIQYEPKDESFCRALGIGKEVLVEDVVSIPSAQIEYDKQGGFLVRPIPEIPISMSSVLV